MENQSKLILIKDLGTKYPVTGNNKRKYRFGIYKCFCGKEFESRTASIKNNLTKSCGCLARETSRNKLFKHGLKGHRLYTIWQNIKSRCLNKNNKRYKDYGGRGISICNQWIDSVENFYNWAINNGYKGYLTIDRINNDGNYEPSNCRWVAQIVQSRNTRKLMVTNTSGFRGVTKNGSRDKFKWVSRISVDNKKITILKSNSKLECAKAYDKYVIDNNLEHTLNFI